jgi:hypothetical protein
MIEISNDRGAMGTCADLEVPKHSKVTQNKLYLSEVLK